MTGADISQLISSSLIKATNLSYVEDAPGTRDVLEKLAVVIRYMERGPGDVRLSEEWALLSTFMELHRIQYPGRFSYEMEDNSGSPSAFTSRYVLLERINTELQRQMSSDPGSVSIRLIARTASNPETGLEAVLSINRDGEVSTLKWKIAE